MTPPEEMSLIPFPVEELFEKHLADFDLVIFDRFGLSELLSPGYFDDLAGRVREGGGLLVVAGDEFAAPGGLADTPLAAVLPARTIGPAIETSFRPLLSPAGRRHPVTAPLLAAWGGGEWGRWGTQGDLAATSGQVLMTGARGKPLLILDRVGKGRVGVLGSTNIWWWSRNVEGAGPHTELLRRTAHWLMQEPDLDEEQLEVSSRGRTLAIRAQGISPPTAAALVDPSGRQRSIALTPSGEGSTSATLEVTADGLYRVDAGRTRFALAGDSAELAEVRPRASPIDKAANASGGGTFWLARGMPRVMRIDAGETAAGRDWLGLVRNRSGAIVAVSSRPLIPPLAALALISASLLLAWWRERR